MPTSLWKVLNSLLEQQKTFPCPRARSTRWSCQNPKGHEKRSPALLSRPQMVHSFLKCDHWPRMQCPDYRMLAVLDDGSRRTQIEKAICFRLKLHCSCLKIGPFSIIAYQRRDAFAPLPPPPPSHPLLSYSRLNNTDTLIYASLIQGVTLAVQKGSKAMPLPK